MLRKFVLGFVLLLSSATMASPGPSSILPPGEAGMGQHDLEMMLDDRVLRLPEDADRTLGLVPLGEEAPAPAEVVEAGELPPIYIQAKVKTYVKVPVGRRRRSMSSRGAAQASAAADSDIIYKTVPKVTRQAVDISPIISKYAKKYNLDPWLIRGVIEVESAFRPDAVSPVGAGGLMQLMPGTASYLGCRDRFDPEQNIAAGARYLRMMKDRFGDDKLMIAAYNAGPGNVERYGGVPPFAETQRYVIKVQRAWQSAKKAKK